MSDDMLNDCRSCGKKCACDEWGFINLIWNGRQQFVGVVRDNKGNLFKLENPDDDSSRRIPITKEQCDAMAWRVTLSNRDRCSDDCDLSNLFYDCSDPAMAQRFKLHPDEAGGTRTDRDDHGVLGATICVGDKVKLALNQAAVAKMVYALAGERLPIGTREAKQKIADHVRELAECVAAERFWAHVLDIKGEPGEDQRLTLLTPNELVHMPPPLASEPFIVARKHVYGHIRIRRLYDIDL